MPTVLVVGSGSAGLSAAVSAAEKGADVLVLERAPKRERGGGSRYTEAYFRLSSLDELAPNFREDFVSLSAGQCDLALVDTLMANALSTVHWARDMGVRFDAGLPQMFLAPLRPRVMPAGGGAAILDALEARALDLGVDFAYERIAHSLEVVDGRVVGVQTIDPTGREETYEASSVILASGGFQGSVDLQRQHLSGSIEGLKLIAPGSKFNQGEGIEMGLAIGAKPAGEYGQFHAETIDPRSEKPDANLMCHPYGVVLNLRGERFIDEGYAPADAWYEEVARATWKQPGSTAYIILDDSYFQIPGWQRAVHTDLPPVTADSLEELVEKLPFEDRETAVRTLRVYNEAARPGGVRDPALDGVSTQAQELPKSNWAYRLETRPFAAYPVACAIVLTFGGLAITPEARAVSVEGQPISGLFCTGETMGLYYGRYVGATGVLRGMVFGRIAGQAAAS